ncbi:MAG TPA: flagellar basal body rod C-terminal domain-containing protein [Geothrix sp.]
MDVFGTALSGLRASSAGLAVQANNVANQLSDGYKAKRVDLVAQASGGVRVSGVSDDPTPAGPAPSNVDLAMETVQGMGFDLMYRANLKVLKTADELTKTTMDLKA